MRLLLFFICFTSTATAQIDQFSREFSLVLPIYYFPFYDGVQLIEVDYYAESLARGSMGDAMYPRGGSDYHDAMMVDRPNGYILRSANGEVIKTYGVGNFTSIELLPPDKSVTITHKERLNTSKTARYGEHFTWKDANGYGYRFGESRKSVRKTETPMRMEHFTGIIDTLGNLVIQDVSTISYAYSEYLVSLNGKYAIYDSTFTKTMDYIEGTVSRAAPNKYFHVTDGTKIIDRYGKKTDRDNYVKIEKTRYGDDYIYSSRTISGLKCGIMRSDLSQLTKPVYATIYPLQKGYSVSNSFGKWALLNENGIQITKFEFERDAFRYYQDGTYSIYKRDKTFKQGKIDTLGNVITPMIYDQVKEFKYDLAVVSLNGKEGIVNRKGEVQGEIIYSKIMNVYSKHVHVNVDGKQGIISHTGEVILEPKFRSVSSFDSDFLYVSNDQNERFFFDVKTKEFIPCPYDQVWGFDQGFCKVRMDGKSGMVDTNMKLVIPLEYDFVSPILNGTIVVKKGNFYGLYNLKFELIKPLKFKRFRGDGSGGYEVY